MAMSVANSRLSTVAPLDLSHPTSFSKFMDVYFRRLSFDMSPGMDDRMDLAAEPAIVALATLLVLLASLIRFLCTKDAAVTSFQCTTNAARNSEQGNNAAKTKHKVQFSID